MKDIEKLIPHRPPFLFVDELTEVDDKRISGNQVFDHGGLVISDDLPDSNSVPEMILIESMIQCGGAGVKMMGLTDGLFGLAHIENANFYRTAKIGEKICYQITNIKVSKKIIKQSGVASVDGNPIADATWMCVRID